ncbi:hypothetical protein ACUXK4_004841 [Methylorubrum extorquens]
MGELAAAAEEARLKADLAKLDAIEAEYRLVFVDERLTLNDVVAIQRTARTFGVSETMAYRRAHELGCLSYQKAPALLAQAEAPSTSAGGKDA